MVGQALPTSNEFDASKEWETCNQVDSSNEWPAIRSHQDANSNLFAETGKVLQAAPVESTESSSKVVSLHKRGEPTDSVPLNQALPQELIQGLQELLRNKDKILKMVTDRPKPLQMKRYRGAAVSKTIQFQAQISERLTGFVNNTGYTLKDVVNKAVEEFLERYGGRK